MTHLRPFLRIDTIAVLLLLIVIIIGPWLSPYDPLAVNLGNTLASCSALDRHGSARP